jgi:hypothetical protein
MQRAFYAIQIPPTAKLIGLTLAWHHNAESGRCDPSVLLLAKETCVCERSISMALKTLEADGHITIIRRTGQHNHYLLHPRSKCGTASDAPPQQMRYTPAADAAKLEVTGRVNRKEPESLASAAANAEDGDSLFPIEPPPPKPARERKPKPEGTADSRLKPIKDGLAPVFEKTKGREFDCDWKKTVGAIRRFLESRSKVTPDEFLEVWSLVCKYSSSPFYPKITDALDVAYLCRNYETVTGHIERAYHSESQTKR